MGKIDWKAKLSSRKVWAGVASAVTMFLGIFGISEELVANIAAIVVGAGGVIVSVLGETSVDVARAQNTQTVRIVNEDGEEIATEDGTIDVVLEDECEPEEEAGEGEADE